MPLDDMRRCLIIAGMPDLIDKLGGPTVVARMCDVRVPSVIDWRRSGIPRDRCPDIERASGGKVTCDEMRPEVAWVRVPDPDWPHPGGRPCIDVAARPVPTEEARDAA